MSSPSLRPTKPHAGWRPWVWVALLVGLTALAMWAVDFTLVPSIRRPEYWFRSMAAFLTPNWEYLPRVLAPLWETFSIAFVASATVAVVTVVVAMYASRTSMRVGWVYRFTKGWLSVWRALPDIVWAMLFVAIVGNGPFAGVIAMAAFGFGIVAKLTAETIDAVEPGPLEAIDAAGGSAFQRARVGIVPAILPNYASYALYNFESTIRGSVVLGYVSAGGVGQALQTQSNNGNYGNVAMIVLATLALVILIDTGSFFLRRWLSR